MQIHVTNLCLRIGISKSCGKCPIAIAMTLAGFRDVEVHSDAVRYRLADGTLTSFPLPVFAQHFVEHFDEADSGEPFSFAGPDLPKYPKEP